jgi:light-independent protochlorophyllide reductase subunit B
MGTYSREFAREVREAAKLYGVEALITDDYLDVEEQVTALQPELVLGTQMERHIAKRLGMPCAVISAPMHVQDFPARHSPQMGFEGANVLFDTWVHPLMMGLEEHLLHMFRDDFEFHAGAAPSHLGSAAQRPVEAPVAVAASTAAPLAPSAPATAPSTDSILVAKAASDSAAGAVSAAAAWTADAEKELKKIPFFVRGKARRNTEAYAGELGLKQITVETLYDAKAHFSR